MSNAQGDDIPLAFQHLVALIKRHTRGSRYWARRSEVIRLARLYGYTETDTLLAANYLPIYECKQGKHILWTRYIRLIINNPRAYKRVHLDHPTNAPKRKAYRPAPRFYAIPCSCQDPGCALCLNSL